MGACVCICVGEGLSSDVCNILEDVTPTNEVLWKDTNKNWEQRIRYVLKVVILQSEALQCRWFYVSGQQHFAGTGFEFCASTCFQFQVLENHPAQVQRLRGSTAVWSAELGHPQSDGEKCMSILSVEHSLGLCSSINEIQSPIHFCYYWQLFDTHWEGDVPSLEPCVTLTRHWEWSEDVNETAVWIFIFKCLIALRSNS